jgi:hypothetical protein
MRTTATAEADLRERLRVSVEPNDTRTPEDTQHHHRSSNNDLLLEEGSSSTRRPGRIPEESDDQFQHIFSGVIADTNDRGAATTSPRFRREALRVVTGNAANDEYDDKENYEDGEIDADDEYSDPRRKAAAVADMAALQDRLRLDGRGGVAALDDGSGALSTLMASRKGQCKGCGKHVPSYFDGVFCPNAFVSRGRLGGYHPACGGIWCRSCYGFDEAAAGGGGGGGEKEDECITDASASSAGDNVSSLRRSTARNGDHLMTAFQCESCHFVNIQGRLPNDGSTQDRLLLRNIQRASLDAFRARDDDEVAGTCRSLREYVECSVELGVMATTFVPPPSPVRDVHGMAVAAACVSIVDANDSAQPIATTGANKFERALAMVQALRTLEEVHRSGHGRVEQPSARSAISGPWFEQFLDGLHLRLTGARRPPMEHRAARSS